MPQIRHSQNVSFQPLQLPRRAALQAGMAAIGALALGSRGTLAVERPARRRAIRLGYLTDVHVQPEERAPEGLASALAHVQNQSDPPQLLLTGGDNIMDSFGAGRDRTRAQWDVWKKLLADHCGLPVEACLGNHDVFGWDNSKTGVKESDPGYGKAWAVEELGLSGRYRSFDRAGWHFVMLDSTHPSRRPGSYIGQLDDEQFEWLAADLAATPANVPVLVSSHIPILSAAVFLDGENERTGNWIVPGSWMHLDARRIKDLFAKHPNVKLCVSGHLHLADRVDYNGVTYLCNGAVCGAWWKGNYHECDEGYALIDLYDDGTFDHGYVSYGWNPA